MPDMIKTTEKPLVISYLRYSTPQQVHGDSKRRQLEMSETWAKARGYAITENFEDLGISAFRGKNARSGGALARILSEVQAESIPPGSILLVESLDRLSREEIPTALQLFLSIVNAGVRIVTLCDGHEYHKAKLDMNDLLTSIAIMSRANDESATKGMRMREKWEKRRSEAADGEQILTNLPAWLELKNRKVVKKMIDGKPVKKTVGNIVKKSDAAKAVKKLFTLAADGYGLGAITRKLNRDGVPPIGRSGRWSKTYVHNLLRGRQVLGELLLRKTIDGKVTAAQTVKGYYPPIIDEKLWERANALLDSKKNADFKGDRGPNAAWVNIFSGLLFDPYGETYFIHQTSSGGKRLCSNSGEQMGKGKRVYVRIEVVEAMVFDSLLKYFSTSFAAYKDQKDETAELRAEVAEIDAKISGIQNEMIDSGGNVKAVVGLLAKLEAKRNDIEKRIRATAGGRAVTDADRVRKLVETYRRLVTSELDYDGRAELQATLRLLVKRIVLDAERTGDNPLTIGGSCMIVPHVGDEIMIYWGYRARRNAASDPAITRATWSIREDVKPQTPKK